MSNTYSKKTWVDGDVITPEHLNQMEDAIESAHNNHVGIVVVNVELVNNGEDFALDKNYNEIKELMRNNLVVVKDNTGEYFFYPDTSFWHVGGFGYASPDFFVQLMHITGSGQPGAFISNSPTGTLVYDVEAQSA